MNPLTNRRTLIFSLILLLSIIVVGMLLLTQPNSIGPTDTSVTQLVASMTSSTTVDETSVFLAEENTPVPTETSTPTGTPPPQASGPTDTPAPTNTFRPTQDADAQTADDLTDTPTVLSTSQTLDDVTSVPTQASQLITIAPTLPVTDVSDRGQTIGEGRVQVVYDNTMKPDDEMLVELELRLESLYITATPESVVTKIPVELDVPLRQVDVLATSTPRPARFEELDLRVPDELIAVLDCGQSFVNCGEKPARMLMIYDLNRWSWAIQPLDGQVGKRNLTLELWTVGDDDSKDRLLWSHGFEVEIVTEGQDVGGVIQSNLGTIIILLIAIIGGIGIWKLVLEKRLSPTSKTKTSLKNINIFISYRRSVSAGFGSIVHGELTSRGANVFFDIDDIHVGDFSAEIRQSIETCDYFIVLLANGTLDSEWVGKEILYAQQLQKPIIPVLLNDFDLYGKEITADFEFLQSQNAVTLPIEHLASGINRIVEKIHADKDKKKKRK